MNPPTDQSSREQEREALRDARYFVELYARRNPRFEYGGEMQDPSGVNACLERIDAVLARPTMLLQDENSGREGRRYNEWHASRPDARLNAREAAASIPPTPITAEEAGREGDGWLPIETAPKDGTHILVSWPMRKMDDDGMPTGEITRRDTLVTWMNGDAWIEPDYLGASGEWYGDDDCYAADPDLWQPLPPAPAQSGGQGNG